MADIVLAEYAGQAWLVRGEQHIDHLLANTLAGHISTVIIACESKSQVNALWWEHEGPDADESLMWLIHPAIVNRVRGISGEITVMFPAWSAAIDDVAQGRLRAAAQAMAQREGNMLTLVRFIAPEAATMAMALADLRCALLEAQLVALGIPSGRMARETRRPEQSGSDDRIDLIIRAPAV